MKKIKVNGLVMSRKEAIHFYAEAIIEHIIDHKEYNQLYHILVECENFDAPIKNWSNQKLQSQISELFNQCK